MPNITLMQGDCLELLKQLPDGSVDMILCDLPYGLTQNRWDKNIPLSLLWSEYNRIAKENAAVVLHCQQPFTSELVMSNKKSFKYCWVWNKHYKRGFLNAKKQPLKCTEDIAVFYKKQCTYNPQMSKGRLRGKGNSARKRGCYGNYIPTKTVNDVYYPSNVLDFAGVPNKELNHSTQKPVPLLEYLIRTYTNDGETVLDNCMGSGSTGVACVNTNRNFIGMELDPQYFEIAKKRIEDAERAKAEEMPPNESLF